MTRNLPAFFFLLILVACKTTHENRFAALTIEEKKKLSFEYVQRASKIPQGTLVEQSLLDTAIFLDSANHKAWMEKSSWFIKIGAYHEYGTCINKAVELEPLSNLGYRAWTRLFCLRDYQGALADLDRLDSLTPEIMDYPWGENIYYLRGLAKMQMGKTEEALAAFTTCIERTRKEKGEEWTDVYAFVYRGEILFELGHLKESIRDFNKALKYHDKCAEAYYYKALALLTQQDSVVACENLKQSFEFARRGYVNTTIYRDVFNQLYIDDIEKQMKLSCYSN